MKKQDEWMGEFVSFLVCVGTSGTLAQAGVETF